MEFRVGPSPELRQQKQELERLLYREVYRHPRLLEMRSGAQARLKEMFAGFTNKTELLPPLYQQRAAQVGVKRSVGDYLAGMTDRYCDQQFAAAFLPRKLRMQGPAFAPAVVGPSRLAGATYNHNADVRCHGRVVWVIRYSVTTFVI